MMSLVRDREKVCTDHRHMILRTTRTHTHTHARTHTHRAVQAGEFVAERSDIRAHSVRWHGGQL